MVDTHLPLDAIEAFRTLTDVEAVRARLYSEAERFGFRYLACSDLPRPDESLQALQLANSWPAEWADRYFSRNYIADDPIAGELYATYYPYSWDEVMESRHLSQKAQLIMDEAADLRLRRGFVVPIHGPDGRTGVLTMAGEHSNTEDRRLRAELHLIALYAYARLKELWTPAPLPQEVRLTPRQAECLHWVAAGKSNWDIGMILGISENTVHTTLENAKRRLGVSTRMQAVLKAVLSGQVRV